MNSCAASGGGAPVDLPRGQTRARRASRGCAPLLRSCIPLLLLWAGVARAAEIAVTFDDGRPPTRLGLERLDADSLEWFVSANDLCRVLDLERFWKPETRKMVFKIGDDRRIQVSVDTRLVLDGDQDVLLHVPVRYRHGSVMLPLEFLERLLVPALPGALRFDRAALTLGVGRGSSDVVGITYGNVGGDTEVRLRLARDFHPLVQATSRELVRVRLFDARVDPLAVTAEQPCPLVRSVRAEQSGREAVLYFELERGVDGFDRREEDDGRTLVLTLHKPPEPVPQPEFKLPAGRATEAEGTHKPCSVLVLDAGHGGTDAGVRGSGLIEKDVTLELATRLKPLLESGLGMRVELVRNGDRALTDERRAELANKTGGDLLVSLHCNGWFTNTASGFEVLFVGAETLRRTAEPAASPASAPARGDDFRPWNSAQLPFAARSQVLAQLLQNELEQRLQIPNRGAKDSDIGFLKGVAMPAVMVEVGFLTNPQEADTISGADFAPQVAAALTAAVQRYCERAAQPADGRLGLGNAPGGEETR
jgi:N-acetylmuramoyl-L-alanine amidase